MITWLGLIAFWVAAFAVFVAAAFAVFVVAAFAFVARTPLLFEDSSSRLAMAPTPSSSELVHLFVLHSNGEGTTDSASAPNVVDWWP